jgi:hypothetical protein
MVARCEKLRYVMTDSKGKIVKATYEEAMNAIHKSKNITSLRKYVNKIKRKNTKCKI